MQKLSTQPEEIPTSRLFCLGQVSQKCPASLGMQMDFHSCSRIQPAPNATTFIHNTKAKQTRRQHNKLTPWVEICSSSKILRPKRKYLGRFHRCLAGDGGLHLQASATAMYHDAADEVHSLLLSFSSCHPRNQMI